MTTPIDGPAEIVAAPGAALAAATRGQAAALERAADPPLESPLATVSAEAFGAVAAPYRRELLVHCYRMLGSIDDAEDAVQDAYVRAWHGRATFRQAISFRAWLYRIATNACLDAIERRNRAHGANASIVIGPFPDEENGDDSDDLPGELTAGPEARYDAHESISLAFTTVLQHLPPRQRAVLILRDVLSWRAAEVAELLELTVPAVNSALHRARTTMASQYRPAGGSGGVAAARHSTLEPGRLRALLERYVQAWEAADIPGLVALLRDDAVLAMPPTLAYQGREAIAAFFADSIFVPGREIRLVPVRANGGPGFAAFSRQAPTGPFTGFAVLLLEVDGSGVARIDAFRDLRLIPRFGLPESLAA